MDSLFKALLRSGTVVLLMVGTRRFAGVVAFAAMPRSRDDFVLRKRSLRLVFLVAAISGAVTAFAVSVGPSTVGGLFGKAAFGAVFALLAHRLGVVAALSFACRCASRRQRSVSRAACASRIAPA